jgi:hypothetical protein
LIRGQPNLRNRAKMIRKDSVPRISSPVGGRIGLIVV